MTRVGMGRCAHLGHPHKRFFFFCYYIYIYVLTYTPSSPAIPPPPPSLDTPTKHEKHALWGVFFVFRWFSSTVPPPHCTLQPDMKTCPIWGHIFVCGYIPSTRFFTLPSSQTFPPLLTFGMFYFFGFIFFTIPPSPYSSFFLFYLAFFPVLLPF